MGSKSISKRVLLVDLNNFARYPSIAIGYLTAVLRNGGYHVEVLAPLSTGITGVPREVPTPWWGRLDLEFRYRTGVTMNPLVRAIRSRYSRFTASKLARSKSAIVSQFQARLDEGFDAVLVSTYLMYYPHCVALGEICRSHDVPMILGGPYFSAREVAEQWIDIPGATALIGGEVENHLCQLVDCVIRRENIDQMQGVWRKKDGLYLEAPPLTNLDNLPFPDYSSFPWSKYPNTIVPLITGRGCGWGACLFCSDITSTVGRTFRSRSPDNVLAELAYQHARHKCRLFVFTDLKINSNLDVWRCLISKMQDVVPGARWIGAVHVGVHGDNGLSANELRQARESGMVRLTTGLETGSQRILNSMAKGTRMDTTSRFLLDAKEAGISVRTTMIIGYPGEQPSDVDLTTDFLIEHERCIERIKLNRLQIKSGTQFAKVVARKSGRFPDIAVQAENHQQAHVYHHFKPTEDLEYRRSISRLLKIVHRINRKPLANAASDFEGVM